MKAGQTMQWPNEKGQQQKQKKTKQTNKQTNNDTYKTL